MNHRSNIVCLLMIFSLAPITDLCAAEKCLDCHEDINLQMKGSSHHVQGTPTTAAHCYICHWEATADGMINKDYHRKEPGRINLVIWGKGERPTAYIPYSTAINFSPAAIGTDSERSEIANVTRHCLACHSDKNNSTAPFAGDSFTPVKYAWDGQSVAARYEQKGVTPWGKYSTATTNKKKQLTKALSAHGNVAANEGGWSPTGGYDSPIPVRGGSNTRDVECYDCHNSHGTLISGVTSSYLTASNSRSGGLLKQTTAGRSGYRVTYTPSVNTDLQSTNPYNPGAGLCFDCHETETTGKTPWGYSTTFGISKPVMGYKDTHKFGSGVKGSTSRYANRQGRSEIVSSHLKSKTFLTYSTTEGIHGICSTCHDPHGVSPTLGAKKEYAVPLLKGTWLTSPYKEDTSPATTIGRGGPAKQGSGVMDSGATGTTKGPVSMQGMQYNVDRNTFKADSRIVENVDTFAGLCLTCHNRLSSEGDSNTARIHRAVKGWGENREHSFPCSKCHQAHNSGLPHLMQTNCFVAGPSGLRNNIGLSWLPEKKVTDSTKDKNGRTSKRSTSITAKDRSTSADFVGCHVKQFGKGSQPKRNENWNEKEKW